MRRIADNRSWDIHPTALGLMIMLALAVGTVQGASDEPKQDREQPRPLLSSLHQIVRTFDFEEPDAAPNSLPDRFYRYIAPSQGFPPFGSMRLTTDVAHQGDGSFEFQLGGGSMSARLPTAVIPILPFTDYSISAWVRTEGLTHSRARIVGWLHDKDGNPIAASVSQSQPVQTNGIWTLVQTEIRGVARDAADLVLELQVIQGDVHGSSEVPEQSNDDRPAQSDTPRLEDTTGRVWFDDVVVSHLPHVTLSMPSANNLVHQPTIPELRILVSELTREALTANVRVFDLDGTAVFDSTFPAPRGSPVSLPVPVPRCGWYVARLQVTNASGITRTESLHFAVLPAMDTSTSGSPRRTRKTAGSNRLGIALDDAAPQQMTAIPDLLAALRCRHAVVPVWNRAYGSRGDEAHATALREMIERLLQCDVDPVFSLERVPEELARTIGVESHQVLPTLARETHIWQRSLDEFFVNFGLEVNRWQIGSSTQPESFWMDGVSTMIGQARRSFSDYVPQPMLYPTWGLDQQPPSHEDIASYSVLIPHHVTHESISESSSPFLGEGKTSSALIEPLPYDQYSARQRVTDLLVRGLHAWRAGFEFVSIRSPWSWRANTPAKDSQVEGASGASPVTLIAQPEPCFAAWRNLAIQLEDRVFVGELPMSDGTRCWMLKGPTRLADSWGQASGPSDRQERIARGVVSSDSTLVIWTDVVQAGLTDAGSTETNTSTRTVPLQLAAGPVLLTDAFGNSQVIVPINGLHMIPVSDMPAFIEHADLQLVQFRAGMHIQPEFIPAVSKVHDLHVVVKNPWNLTISGTMRFADSPEWNLSPATMDFTVQANGEVRLHATMIPQRSILAGEKQLAAQINVTADQPYLINLTLPLRVGIENIDMTPSWTTQFDPATGTNDLIVTQAVTNHGKTDVHLDVYLVADGQGQMRRTIAGLGPGETAVRMFRIVDGAKTYAGKHIRVGVAERDGLNRLNRLLAIGSTANRPIAQAAER